MKRNAPCIALAVAGLLSFSASALADKPSWAGGGKAEKKHEQSEDRQEARRDAGSAGHFDDDTRRIISDYYGKRARSGKCPPGLAKKNNGCLPPGQARKWARGHALPADVQYNDLPRELIKRLPPPPSNHRYVQIAGDILLIAKGTSMVIDAVEDILR